LSNATPRPKELVLILKDAKLRRSLRIMIKERLRTRLVSELIHVDTAGEIVEDQRCSNNTK